MIQYVDAMSSRTFAAPRPQARTYPLTPPSRPQIPTPLGISAPGREHSGHADVGTRHVRSRTGRYRISGGRRVWKLAKGKKNASGILPGAFDGPTRGKRRYDLINAISLRNQDMTAPFSLKANVLLESSSAVAHVPATRGLPHDRERRDEAPRFCSSNSTSWYCLLVFLWYTIK